jgi:predicted HAD superfamily Cof-like phosphohydrolase
MSSHFQDVYFFHKKMRLPAPDFPTLLDPNTMFGRVEMMLEEIKELMEAFRTRDVVPKHEAIAEITDALIDLVYFALGTGVLMGVPWDMCWRFVQEANMQKELVGNPAESKRHNVLDVKKPVGWVDPRFKIADLLDIILRDEAQRRARGEV